jgi:hypothetical protein
VTYTFPSARPHGVLTELFPDVFFVTGTMRFSQAPVQLSRNMVVVRQGGALTLINTLRLDDAGLAALEKLGRVEHVVRLAGFHGSDDPFYKERYGATVWAVKGHAYARGFSIAPKPEAIYFRADRTMEPGSELPVPGRLFAFESCPCGEGILVLDREGGIAIPGDALQNWVAPDPYFNWLGRWSMRAMGFFRPHNVGPGWLKQIKPDPAELRAVLDLPFEHVLPAHGEPVRGNAREKYRPALTAAAEWSARARG